MSGQVKILASLSGAVAAHLLLFLLLIFLLSTRKLDSALREAPAKKVGPQEVTVMLSDLLDQVEEIEKSDVPPEEEVHEESSPRPFIATDLNTPEAEAPEDAKFESDRNTSAATEILPDSSEAQWEGPTTVGVLPIERLTLQKREFVEGELDRPAAPPGVDPAAEGNENPNEMKPGGGFPSNPSETGATSLPQRPETESETGEEDEMKEGDENDPEFEIAPEKTRPEETITEGDAEETTAEKSFTLPGGDPLKALPDQESREDAFAATQPRAEDPIGEPTDLEKQVESSRGGEGDDPEAEQEKDTEKVEESIPEAMEPAEEVGMRPADQGLFADGFSPEEMQSTTNGTLTNLGQNAVDAEGTEVGKYKNQVRQIIAKKWHQYRMENQAAVTWGILKLKCRVDRHGKVHGLRIVENKANTMLADFSLRAILDAKLPPMPEEVAAELGKGGLELNYDIIIY